MNEMTKKTMEKPDIELLKRTVCKGATDDELTLFLHICKNTGLDPFMKQIYAIKRGSAMTYQTSIDGLRLVADRSGNYSPGRESSYMYNDKGEMVSATSYVKKRTSDGTWHEVSSCVFMKEYKPTYESKFWTTMPHVMLAKCAEANVLRKAFPAELCGLYTGDEMAQSENEVVEIVETLSESQVQEITLLIGEDDFLRVRILKGYSVNSLNQIAASEFEPMKKRIIALLKASLAKENE